MARLLIPSRHRGVILMEAAIVLLMLVFLTFGAMEYGWIFTKEGEIHNAVQQGARVGIRAYATSADVTSAVQELMDRAHLSGSGYTITITPGDITTLDKGEYLTVEVSVPYSNIALTGFSLIPVPTALHGAMTMAREGP